MNNQKIGDFIKELRKEKGLTQKDLALKLNITDRAVSKWERGLSCPDISLLDDLSRILEVSIIELLKGRRLDSDEKINNKELVETMTFANDTFKNKIKKVIDIFSITVVSFIALLLLFYNIKGFYYSNKVYKRSIDENINVEENFNNKTKIILENIALIEENKGIYTDSEYELIMKFVSDIKYLTNKEIENELLNKYDLTINDFNRYFDNMSIYDIYGYDGLNEYKNIYKIILKYNIDKYDNMLNYTLAQRLCFSMFQELTEIYYPIYKYGYQVKPISYENYISIINELKYNSYNYILKDIIEVGGIYE